MTDKLKKIVAEAMNNRPSDFKSLVEEVLSAKQKAFVAKKLDEATGLSEAVGTHIWYDTRGIGDRENHPIYDILDQAESNGIDIANAETHPQYRDYPHHCVGIPTGNKGLNDAVSEHLPLAWPHSEPVARSFTESYKMTDKERNHYDKIACCHGPLMNGAAWISPRKVQSFLDHPELADTKHFLIGKLKDERSWGEDNTKNIIIPKFSDDEPKPEDITSKDYVGGPTKIGYNVPHKYFIDTGMGHRFPEASSLVITGHISRTPDGGFKQTGDIDHSAKHSLHVYK